MEQLQFLRKKLLWMQKHNITDASNLQQQIQTIFDAIDKLPKPIMKTVILMYYLEGLSVQAIARSLNFSYVYISKTKSTALTILINYL
jgi:DNA-directed RNA polymerase specialized sigma subunit